MPLVNGIRSPHVAMNYIAIARAHDRYCTRLDHVYQGGYMPDLNLHIKATEDGYDIEAPNVVKRCRDYFEMRRVVDDLIDILLPDATDVDPGLVDG